MLLAIVSLNSFSKTITLNDALKIAEKENPQARKERINLEIKKLQKGRKFKAFLPSFNLTMDTDDGKFDDDLNPFDQEIGVDLTATMPLFTGGRLTSEYKKSKIELEKTSLQKELLSYDIRETVINKYFEVLNNRKQVKILISVDKTLKEQHERLEKLYSSNKLVRKSEVLRVKSDILTNEVALLEVEQKLEISVYELQILLGISMDEKLAVEEYEYQEQKLNNFYVDEDIEVALDRGSRIKLLKLDVASKEEDLTIAKSAYYPQVGLGFEKSFKRAHDGLDSYRLGIGFRWNIFRWGSDMDGVSIAEYNIDMAKIDLEDKKSDVVLEIRKKYSTMVMLSKQLESQKLNVEIAKENIKIDTLRYNNSLMSSFEYLDSVDRTRKAEEGFYVLQRNLMLSVDTYKNSWK